jgi:hypothetical protein
MLLKRWRSVQMEFSCAVRILVPSLYFNYMSKLQFLNLSVGSDKESHHIAGEKGEILLGVASRASGCHSCFLFGTSQLRFSVRNLEIVVHFLTCLG